MVNNFNKDSSFAKSVELLALSFAIVLITLNFSLQAETTSVCPAGCQYGSIQNAVDAAEPGDTIKVKAGTYKENVKIDKNLSLVGEGKNKVRVEGSRKGHPVIRIGPGRVQVKLKGLKIAGARGELCANSEKNLCYDGVSVSGQAKVDMVNCSVTSNGINGIYLGEDSRASVTSCIISGNGATGIILFDSASANLRDNRIVDNEGLGIYSWTDKSVIGTGNKIIRNRGALAGDLAGGLREKLREPSKEKIALPDKHYPTLQHAVDALLPGGKIALTEGEYQGGVVIDKQVTIVGNGKQRTTIQGGYPGLSLIQDGDLTLKNVGIVNNTKGIIGSGNSKAKLKNCVVSENKMDGAEFQDSSQAAVEGCIVSDNGDSGICFFNSAQGNLKESTFSENVEGISPADSSQVKIQNCVLRGNEVGLGTSSKSRAKVKNTRIEESKYAGIDAGGSSQVIVENCSIVGNGKGVGAWDSSLITLTDNRIKNNERAGVAGNSSQAVQGRGNEIVDNGVPMKGNFSEGLREKLRKPSKERITLPDKDYPTLQHAVDALLPGGKIELKEGEYQGGVLIDKGLTITGKKGKETAIEGGYIGLTLLKDAELTLKNLKVDSEAEGLFLAGDSKAYLHKLTVKGNRTGIVLSDSTRAELDSCLITENRGIGIYLYGSSRAKVVNSSIHNNGKGIWIYEPRNKGRLTGFGNKVYDNDKDFSNVSNEVRKQLTESEKPARIGKVCPSGCKYSSIQNAVEKVRAGGVIKVEAGTYEENVKINKDLTLKGAGSSKATIDGAKEGSPIVSVGPAQVKVTIEGLTLCDAEGGGYQEIDEEHRPEGISVKGKAKVEIRNSTVTDNVAGLVPLDSAELAVYNSEITDNIYGFVGGGGPWASPKLTVKSSTITENIVGFFLSGSTEARVEDSAITDNHVFGVLLYDSSRVVIKNSKVSETQWNGLVLRGSSQARVEESTIKANGEDGIALVGSSNLNLINSSTKDNQKGLVIYSPDEFKGTVEGYGNQISNNETNFGGVPKEVRKYLSGAPGLLVPVDFPDPNLEQAIREAIDKSTGDIYPSELEGLSKLHARGKGITDLTGIEYCKDLTELDLADNQIFDISPLVDNKGLVAGDRINLTGNRLDPSRGSIDKEMIRKLEDRDVWINYEPQKTNQVFELERYIRYVIEASPTEELNQRRRRQMINRIMTVLTNRLIQYGITGRKIRALGDKRIELKLPADILTDIDPRILGRLIGRTGWLEFQKMIKAGSPGSSLSPNDLSQEVVYGRRQKEGKRTPYLVKKDPLLAGDVLRDAEVKTSQSKENQAILKLQLNSKGARKFGGINTNLRPEKERIAVVIDNVVHSILSISQETYEEALTGKPVGRVKISSDYSRKEAQRLAIVLRAGPMPVEIDFIEKRIYEYDKHLEKAIRKEIDKPEGKVYQSDLERLTSLEATSEKISKLWGLEYCKNLKKLDLSHNSIENIIPLVHLTNLEEIDLQGNKISDIWPLVNNKDLDDGDKLDLRNNYLDLSEGSKDMEAIQTLIDRRVEVEYGQERGWFIPRISAPRRVII